MGYKTKLLMLQCQFLRNVILHTGAKTNFLSRYYQHDVWKIWFLRKNEPLKLWILWKMRLWKCEFYEKWDFRNVIFFFFWKMRLWKCEFCEKWDIELCVKNEIFKMWICRKLVFQNVNFVKMEIFKWWIWWKNQIFKIRIFGWIVDFCPSVRCMCTA